LIRVYVALLALTAATVGAAFLPLGRLSFAAAMGIASLKAGLVAWRFMEIGRSPRAARLLAVAGLAVLALLIGPVLLDRLSR
jgi:cytochrome c oxidase subunit 4